jgi:hypothetical protein
MKKLLLALTVVALIILHQDFWYWTTSDPLVFGFLPIGLFYHACFTVAVALLMWVLVKTAWPSHLEAIAETDDPQQAQRLLNNIEEGEAR